MSRRFCLYVDIGDEASDEGRDLYQILLEEILQEVTLIVGRGDWDINQALKGRSLKDWSGNRVGRMWVSDPTCGS